ncbi:sugar phosphate isomerase/epimerase family protein [Tepidibacter formicigenes]|uniref:Sugar phosphate isomerase/epimerase n=1 Tax=Tepidibacter formicigenes DSM 15518 TaxID=1123349 RepID=A0A1M6N552_9FIRM|nr:TIM barrel protein [Tepidibacter formicigenes]SHJ90788.1 Sugar phosphate isomerase/epimerase [Tepidibacter formicigenes DSM 15518]
MKLGISAMAYDIKEKIDICKELGFNHIEVGIDNLEDWDFLYEEKEELKKNDISIGVHMPMELNTCESIKYIRKCWIDFFIENYKKGKILDVKYYNLHLGYGLKNRVKNYREKYLNNTLCFFQKVLENITNAEIYIENTYVSEGHLVNLGDNVNDFEYIFKNVKKDNFGFCYDSGHNLINSDDYVNKLSSYIKLIHLSNNDGKSDLHLGLSEIGLLSEEDIKYLLNLKSVKYIVLEMNEKFFQSSKNIIFKNL